jgi:hypothetical protein
VPSAAFSALGKKQANDIQRFAQMRLPPIKTPNIPNTDFLFGVR